jgi:tRNA (cytidine56-2'-O)-methyltransferase
MNISHNLTVLRLSHRPSRDKRVSTHLFLAARALGATKAIYTGTKDLSLEESIKKIKSDWGGDFEIFFSDSWKKTVKEWKGKIIHLTMYGIPFKEVIDEIKKTNEPLLIIVGGAKVPGEIYGVADWNVAVTNQPHSEVSAMALFLNEFYDGEYLSHEFPNARIIVVPSKKGKMIQKIKTSV